MDDNPVLIKEGIIRLEQKLKDIFGILVIVKYEISNNLGFYYIERKNGEKYKLGYSLKKSSNFLNAFKNISLLKRKLYLPDDLFYDYIFISYTK